MNVHVNDTSQYHMGSLDTLGWEVTVCNMLQSPQSPCRALLEHPDSYGNLLYRFLENRIPMDTVNRVLEVGGGYGNLMHDFLENQPGIDATMIDISPALLEKQRQTLTDVNARFIESDFLQVDPLQIEGHQLAIMNENIGDFPTLCDIPLSFFHDTKPAERPELASTREYFERYSLDIPGQYPAAFNLGAAMALEKLCLSGIPFIFMSEHSCQASVPGDWSDLVHHSPSANPERIPLHGHDEYTIRFSDLEKVAAGNGYTVERGNFNNILHCQKTPLVRFILTSGANSSDGHEIIRQFIEDVFKYEYILCIKL